jgi:hypothetical protein
MSDKFKVDKICTSVKVTLMMMMMMMMMMMIIIIIICNVFTVSCNKIVTGPGFVRMSVPKHDINKTRVVALEI